MVMDGVWRRVSLFNFVGRAMVMIMVVLNIVMCDYNHNDSACVPTPASPSHCLVQLIHTSADFRHQDARASVPLDAVWLVSCLLWL